MTSAGNNLTNHFRRVVGALPFVRNKTTVLTHILWPSRSGTVEYRLSCGLVLLVGGTKKNRPVLFTVKEIFGDGVYNLPAGEPDPLSIVDLGANVGLYSLYGAMKYPGATIYGVEPDPENFAAFQANIDRNSLQGRIIPLQAAVSAEDGEMTLYLNAESDRGHSLIQKTGHSVKVSAITLDQLFKRFAITRCDVLKMDIEGAEYDALFGCSDELLSSVQNILVEYHDWFPADSRRTPTNLKSFLCGKGFRILRDEEDILLATNSAPRR